MENELLQNIDRQFSLSVLPGTGREQLLNVLSQRINYLIINDFSWLVQALYRQDVNEAKLEKLLKENEKYDAANIIAALVLEREEEKIASRKKYRQSDSDFDEVEKWQ